MIIIHGYTSLILLHDEWNASKKVNKSATRKIYFRFYGRPHMCQFTKHINRAIHSSTLYCCYYCSNVVILFRHCFSYEMVSNNSVRTVLREPLDSTNRIQSVVRWMLGVMRPSAFHRPYQRCDSTCCKIRQIIYSGLTLG